MASSEPRSAAERLASLQGAGATTEQLVEVVKDGDAVIGESLVPGGTRLDFTASNIRRERTGVHARVAISIADAELGYDTFNIEKIADRVRLANAAAERAGDRKKWAGQIRLRLDQFCSLVWPHWVESDAPEVVVGVDGKAATVLIHPYVTDSRTILFAPGGSGKSWLALIWALTLRYGLQTPWRAPVAKEVLYLDFEDTTAVFQSRLNQAARLLDCPAEMPYYSAEGKGMPEVWDALRTYVEKREVGLVIVDSISRLGLGKLIDDGTANQGVNMMNRLGVPWLALGHTSHAGGDHVFGSVHWENGARVVIKGESSQAASDESVIGLRLSVTKANHIRRGQETTWAFGFSGDALSEHRPAIVSDFPDLADTRPVKERIRDYLGAVGAAPVDEICEYTEANERTVRRVLMDGEGMEFVREAKGGGRGQKATWKRLALGA